MSFMEGKAGYRKEIAKCGVLLLKNFQVELRYKSEKDGAIYLIQP